MKKLLVVILLLAAHGLAAYAAGTITLANTIASRSQWCGAGPSPATVFGVFWGTNRDELTLVFPLATNNTVSGLIAASSPYLIPGTQAGQTVFLQIKGWLAHYGTNWNQARASGYFAETDIRQVTLASQAGPGTIIWQSPSGTNPSRFYPLLFGVPLTPPAVVWFAIPSSNSAVIVDEGNQGTVDAIIQVFRYQQPGTSNSFNFTTAVTLSTSDLTAVAGEDYIATNVAVVFNPGETVREARIKIIANAAPEPEEQFAVRLAGNAGCELIVNSNPLIVTIREARVISVRLEAAHPVISIQTTATQRYALESSIDLISWTVVPGAFNFPGNGSPMQFTDTSAPCCEHRFYRSRILP